MRYNFRIGVGRKFLPFGNEFFFQHQVVFDNAVVYNNKIAAFIRMRMGVAVGRPAVSCPACMADAHAAFGHSAFQLMAQGVKAAHAFFNPDFAFFVNRNTGGIITAVFQLAHSVQQKRRSLCIAYVTNNTTHIKILLKVICQFCRSCFVPHVAMGLCQSAYGPQPAGRHPLTNR